MICLRKNWRRNQKIAPFLTKWSLYGMRLFYIYNFIRSYIFLHQKLNLDTYCHCFFIFVITMMKDLTCFYFYLSLTTLLGYENLKPQSPRLGGFCYLELRNPLGCQPTLEKSFDAFMGSKYWQHQLIWSNSTVGVGLVFEVNLTVRIVGSTYFESNRFGCSFGLGAS